MKRSVSTFYTSASPPPNYSEFSSFLSRKVNLFKYFFKSSLLLAFSVPYPHTPFLYYDFMKYPDSQPSRTIIFVSFLLKRPSLSQDLAYQWRISSFSTAYHCKAPFHSPFQLDLWTSHTAPRHRGVWCPCVVAAARLN